MVFFQSPGEPETAQRAYVGPVPGEWANPPQLMLPGLIPQRRRLADTPERCVVLVELRAYPQGCLWELSAVLRTSEDWATARRAWSGLFGGESRVTAEGELRPELLRFGVRYAEGSSASTLTAVPALREDSRPPPAPPVLYARPTSAGPVHDSEWMPISLSLWQWPLPPAEPFELLFGYPLIGVPETSIVFDGDRIREAADEASPMIPGAG